MTTYNFEKFYFLVVDDNRHMRSILVNILRSIGGKFIFEAEDGATALTVMKTTSIDLVITDWVMGPIDGIEFTKQIRNAADSPNPYVPIIVLTGYTEQSRVMDARDAGVTEFLAKPISAKALLSRLISIIDEPRPFVTNDSYRGPDRRRHRTSTYMGEERRGIGKVSKEEQAEENIQKESTLKQEDVQTLLQKRA